MALILVGVRDVLVISPYRAQAASAVNLLGTLWPTAGQVPRVQSVDESHGCEADAVVILLARDRGSPGILRSVKRATLATSRARYLQYFVGSWAWASGEEVRKDSKDFHSLLMKFQQNIPSFMIMSE
ncbi:hypothetical protein ASPCADRAFT_7379 [Aspergillus carbonarius ITEM 5010]|uniref:DNA2/NAM7 helicase-like C-terminal domain-containing protein n=1 Tax=Aspergillus carbonarius (strain ITEM 5010) TaxID=602072 RepID=A0A1R3RHE2_ASPC5|nr:hypothetical protein ASPCADRAFT_7379 [Aspergillus carbonarius ITEM 5010]